MSKLSLYESKPLKLLIAVGGIYTTYIYYGLIMERLFNQDYSGLDRKKGTFQAFKFGFATSLFQNIFSYLLAAFVNRNEAKTKVNIKSQITLGALTFFSVFLASQALAYVSFPVQAIMKSSKIISILIVSLILRSRTQHSKSQYLCGFLITSGIVLFNFAQEGHGKHGSDSGTSIVGIAILVVSLFCDGLLGVKQEEAKKEYKPSAWELMELTNKWGILICFITALLSSQFMDFIEYVKTYPAVWTDLILLSFLGTVGQIFIYYTISNFSPLVLSIITTTRKFFTVLSSIVIYNHSISLFQWISIGLVFIGVFMEMLGSKKKHDLGKKKEEPTQEIQNSILKSKSIVKTSQKQNQISQRR